MSGTSRERAKVAMRKRGRALCGFRPSHLSVLIAVVLSVGCGTGDESGTSQESGNPSSTASNRQPRSTRGDRQEQNGQQPNSAPSEPVAPFEPLEHLTKLEADVVGVNAIVFATDGQTFVTASGTPRIWQIGSDEPLYAFEELYPLTGEVVEAEALAISSDGSTLAIAGGDGLLHLFDFATREPRQSIEAHQPGVLSVAFSLDGNTVATSGYDGKAKLWNSKTGELGSVFEVDEGRGVKIALAPDGKTLVSVGTDALVWSAETGEKIGDLNLGEPRAARVRAVAITADGQHIATAELNKEFENGVLIWSTGTRKLTGTLRHEIGVTAIAFSPNGQLIATASADAKARIWQVADGSLLQTIEDEELNSVDDVAWTPDGKILAVVSEGTIRFWGPEGAIQSGADAPGEADAISAAAAEGKDSLSDVEVLEVDTMVAPDIGTRSEEVLQTASLDQPNPATVEMMSQMIDLKNFSRIEGGDYQTTEATEIGYLAPVPLPEARDFYRKRLAEAGWTELEQSIEQLDTDQSWLREFEKEGYFLRLFLNALPQTLENQQVTIELLHTGNVDTRKLPMPSDANKTFEAPMFTSFSTEVDADTFLETCRKQFEELGWTDQGVEESASGRNLTLLQSSIRLQINIQASGDGTDVYYNVFAIKK